MKESLFKDNFKSYLIISLLGIIAGISVIYFYKFPNNDLWAFSYWSSLTLGFWMFSTSLIVLFSEKRKTAFINTIIYIFIMFLMTTIYKSFRLFWNAYTPYDSILELSINSIWGWLKYSIVPALLCGILALVLWNGKKDKLFAKILRILPILFILVETIYLFYNVFVNHTKLFSAITNLVWLLLYIIIIYKYSRKKV